MSKQSIQLRCLTCGDTLASEYADCSCSGPKDGQTVTIKRCPQCDLRYETSDPWQKCCNDKCLSDYLAYLNRKEET